MPLIGAAIGAIAGIWFALGVLPTFIPIAGDITTAVIVFLLAGTGAAIGKTLIPR